MFLVYWGPNFAIHSLEFTPNDGVKYRRPSVKSDKLTNTPRAFTKGGLGHKLELFTSRVAHWLSIGTNIGDHMAVILRIISHNIVAAFTANCIKFTEARHTMSVTTSSSAMAERPRELGDFKKARVNGGTNSHSLKDSHKCLHCR